MCNMHFSHFCLSLMFISLFCVCLFYGLVPELNVLMMMMMMIDRFGRSFRHLFIEDVLYNALNVA